MSGGSGGIDNIGTGSILRCAQAFPLAQKNPNVWHLTETLQIGNPKLIVGRSRNRSSLLPVQIAARGLVRVDVLFIRVW